MPVTAGVWLRGACCGACPAECCGRAGRLQQAPPAPYTAAELAARQGRPPARGCWLPGWLQSTQPAALGSRRTGGRPRGECSEAPKGNSNSDLGCGHSTVIFSTILAIALHKKYVSDLRLTSAFQ